MENYSSLVLEILVKWKWKPEVEFQHEGHLFPETEISNMSATDREMSPKFGVQCISTFLVEQKYLNEIGSKISMLRPSSWKIDVTSTVGVDTTWMKFSSRRPLDNALKYPNQPNMPPEQQILMKN